MKTAIPLLCLVALMLCATISARHMETPPPHTFEEDSMYEEMQDAEQDRWAPPSFWYSFNPSNPPRWNSDEEELLRTMFGNVRSEPSKGPRRWHTGHDTIDSIMNKCVGYDDYRSCSQKFFWDGSCKWNAAGLCGPNFSSCNAYIAESGTGRPTVHIYPCQAYMHWIN
jgi:hypothetical protein